MRCSHSVTIAISISKEIFTSDVHLDTSKCITANTLAKVGRCRFGAYIDDIFVMGADGKEVRKAYDRSFSTISKRKLPPKPSKCVRPTMDPVIILAVALTSIGLIESSSK